MLLEPLLHSPTQMTFSRPPLSTSLPAYGYSTCGQKLLVLVGAAGMNADYQNTNNDRISSSTANTFHK